MAKEKSYEGFSAEERAAMKERAAELKSSGARGAKKAGEDLQDVLDKIAEMSKDDRAIAETLHPIVTSQTPDLAPKTWYGMPATNAAINNKLTALVKKAAS